MLEGTGNLTGCYVAEGITFVTLDAQVSGELHATTSDGATISETYAVFFEPIDATTFAFTADEQYGDGTGRLTGVTGEATETAVLDALTGAFPVTAERVWTLP